MKIIYGTTNEGKIKQVQDFLEYNNYDVQLVSLKDIGFDEDIDENGETLEENSRIKAKAIRKFCNTKNIKEIVVADDAGLMVDSLNRKTRSAFCEICRRSCTTRGSIG